MKHYVLSGLIALCMTTAAHAEKIFIGNNTVGKVDYEYLTGNNANTVGVSVARVFDQASALEFRGEFSAADGPSIRDQIVPLSNLSYSDNTRTLTNRFEVAYNRAFALNDSFILTTRSAIGQTITENNSYAHYSIEPGIKTNLNSNNALGVSYRYRNTFTDEVDDTTNRVKINWTRQTGLNSWIEAGVSHSWGNSDWTGNGFTLALGHRF